MKIWLLQQKRTNHWPTTKATADACYALLLNGSDWITSQQTVSIQLGDYKINSNEGKTEAGTGYFKETNTGRSDSAGNGKYRGDSFCKILIQPPIANRQLPTVNRRQQPFMGRCILAIF